MSDLVVVSLEAWDAVWRRNQHLVAGLLRDDPALRVLFVEPPADPLHSLRRRSRPRAGAGLRAVLDLPGAEGRLWRLQATKLLPRRLDARADDRLAGAVEQAAARLGFVEPRLWVNDPGGATLLRRTGWPALYDVTDDWVAADRSPAEHSRLLADERFLLHRCAEVVVCSPALADTKGRERPVTLIPNAVDIDAYRRPGDRPTDLPAGPVALYLGTIHPDRIDLDLCVDTAAALSGVGSLVLVGPALVDRATLRRLSNAGVILLGPKDRRLVASYLVHADVLVVPHVVDAFTDSLDPIKAYEYRAAGRPVVSTAVAGFREQAGMGVKIAGRAEFAAATRSAVTQPAPRSELDVEVPTWDDRAAQMAAVIERLAPPSARTGRGRSAPRVLFLNHSIEPGGAELALCRLLLSGSSSWSARLLTPGPTPGVFGKLANTRGVSLVNTGESMGAGVVAEGSVRAWARTLVDVAEQAGRVAADPGARTADVMYANSARAAVYGTVANAVLRLPVVVHLRDEISTAALGRLGSWAMRRLVLPRAAAVVANSEYTLATAERGSRLPRFRAVVQSPIGSGFNGEPAPVAPDIRRVGMAARIAEWKGQHVLIEAFAQAFAGTDVTLHLAGGVLFGEEAYRARLDLLVRRLGVEDQVVFEGHLEDVPRFIDSLDICVHCSVRPEPLGQNVLQYLMRGRPVVVAAAGEPARMVADGVNGRHHPPGDVAALAAVLAELAADRAQRRRLAEAARRTATAISADDAARQVGQLVRLVLEAQLRR